MPRPDDPRESSIAALAREYIRRTKQGFHGKVGKDPRDRETLFEEGETHLTYRDDPTKAALLGLVLPGGGFLYVRKPFLASAALMGLLITGTLFGSVSSVFPSWISGPLLRDLHWDFPVGPSMAISGILFSFIWWVSIVWPVWSVRQRIPKTYRPTDDAWKLLGGSILPMVGQFSQGKFWVGYFVGIFYFWLPLSAASATKIWNHAATESAAKAAQVEPYFIGSIVFLAISSLIVLAALGYAVAGAFSELGWMGRHRDVGTEWKFVALGTLVIAAVAFFIFVGRPGDRARQWLWDSSLQVDARGFPASATSLRRMTQGWERAALPMKDFLMLVK